MGVTSGIRRELRDALQRGAVDIGRDVLSDAIADAPPSPPPGEDPNEAITLKESGYVEELAGGGVEIGFRGVPYAVKLHENFRLKHPRGGVPKFLERNVTAAAPLVEGRIAVEIRKTMARRTSKSRHG